MKTKQYIESRIAALDKLRKEALKEYQTKNLIMVLMMKIYGNISVLKELKFIL